MSASVTAPAGVTAARHAAPGGTCTTTPQTSVTTWQTFSTCVSVTVPTGSVATSAVVTVTLVGQQLQGAVDGGQPHAVAALAEELVDLLRGPEVVEGLQGVQHGPPLPGRAQRRPALGLSARHSALRGERAGARRARSRRGRRG